jgi:phosphomannomutase
MSPSEDRRPAAARLVEAQRWRRDDPDPRTGAELDAVIERADPDELAELFGGTLEFGTAGLRAPLGPGPMRMNRLVVRHCAAGIASVLGEMVHGAAHAGVVVGHDARHGSAEFAEDVTSELRAHGLKVHRFDGPVPTPLASFALRHLHAASAVVVTASHNPATDNGLKVYWADGAQIVPPIDRRIADAMRAAATGGTDRSGGPLAGRQGGLERLGAAEAGSAVVTAYLDEAATIEQREPPRRPRPLAVTSLHGVGGTMLELVLGRGGHGPVHHVASQRHPDAEFPTVAFPNPEEPGAMDEVLALAARTGAALAIANDPDADRLALGVPHPDGTWHRLSGDETGAVLAHHLLERTGGVAEPLLVTTVVSSRLLAAMATAAGVHFAETLTGFKWLCRPALEHPGWHQLLAYEEALGYAVGPNALDKDGLTAALVAADAVCELAEHDQTVWDVLDDLARSHGAHVTLNGAMRARSAQEAQRLHGAAARLDSAPPDRLGGLRVVDIDRPGPGITRMWLQDGTRAIVRPSGTEAKTKYYLEAIEEVGDGEHADAARARARVRLTSVETDLRHRLR